MLRLFLIAWLFCPLLGADIGVLSCLVKAVGKPDPFLGIAALIFAAPLVLVQWLLIRWLVKLPRT